MINKINDGNSFMLLEKDFKCLWSVKYFSFIVKRAIKIYENGKSANLLQTDLDLMGFCFC